MVTFVRKLSEVHHFRLLAVVSGALFSLLSLILKFFMLVKKNVHRRQRPIAGKDAAQKAVEQM